MKITIFFRSREKSNTITSATKHQLLKFNVDKFIDIDFINLDKRNLKKYLLTTTPEIVYLWHDEENANDYIEEHYPNIIIKTYSENEANKIPNHFGYDFKFLLAQQIIDEIKDSTGFIEYYEINPQNGMITKQKTTEYEYYNLPNKRLCFKSKKEAIEFLTNEMTKNITQCKKNIASELRNIEKYKTILEKYKNTLFH